MIKIVARRKIKPECENAFLTLASELAKASNNEEGCAGYTLNRCREDEHLFAFIEYWKDQEAIDSHNASEPFRRIVPQFDLLTEQKFAVEHYTELI